MASPRQAVPFEASQDFEQLKAKHLAEKTLFQDPLFPPNASSIGGNSNVKWLRPKEICAGFEEEEKRTPKFIVDGVSRHDINQGQLGNCWVLSGIVALCDNPKLFAKVVDTQQGFDDGQYCGIFRFRFWRFGEWTEVCVDDFLPVIDGDLMFLRGQRETKNEFWAALFEKAYAKMFGSYLSIQSGQTEVSIRDFSGGVVRFFKLADLKPDVDLHRILIEALSEGALIGCGINPKSERLLSCGLDTGHAYTINAAAEVKGENLIRVRNPHGADGAEWNGAWSDDYKFKLIPSTSTPPDGWETMPRKVGLSRPRDVVSLMRSEGEVMVAVDDGIAMRGNDPVEKGFLSYRGFVIGKEGIFMGDNPTAVYTKQLICTKGSDEWKSLDEETKQSLGLKLEKDGEFWMSWSDFLKYFDTVTVCTMSADSLNDTADDDIGWQLQQFHGSWKLGFNSGGCRNNSKTYHMNPEYLITLTDIATDDDNKCDCYFALMHKEPRGQRMTYRKYFRGMEVFSCAGGRPRPTDLIYEKPVASLQYTNSREISTRVKLPPGDYLLVPSTFDYGVEGDFLLRIYSESRLQTAAEIHAEDAAAEMALEDAMQEPSNVKIVKHVDEEEEEEEVAPESVAEGRRERVSPGSSGRQTTRYRGKPTICCVLL